MNQNQYLIPANTKKGELLLGIFRPIDAAIFGIGVGITLLLLLILSAGNLIGGTGSILAILPAGIATMLVFPFPNYHNVMVAIGELIAFYTNRQKYVWRGWCTKYEFKDK